MLPESYPVAVRSIGLSLAGIAGAIAFIVSQMVFTVEQEFGIHPFLLIALIYFCISGFYQCVPETLGTVSGDYIEEVAGEGQK